MNRHRKVLLAATLALLSCKNKAPLPLKVNVEGVVDDSGKETIRYEIESDPGVLITFKAGAPSDRLGLTEPNGRVIITTPVWDGYEGSREVEIHAEKTEWDGSRRSGDLKVVAHRTPRFLSDHCIVADHKCTFAVACDAVTVDDVETGTIVAVGTSQEKATSKSVRVPIDACAKVPTALLLGPDETEAGRLPITITFPDGAKVQGDALLRKLHVAHALSASKSGRAVRFGEEPATGGTRGLLHIFVDKIAVLGSATTVAEIDLVANEIPTTPTKVDCGGYLPFRGPVSGSAWTHTVTVWERRTGKLVATREFKPKGNPRCPASVEAPLHATSIDVGSVGPDPKAIEGWLVSFVGQ